ncbi:hypothetical protein [Novosphingobium album (ex Liu et al. 2023)]|uniref:Glycosidase n=1 Tax=Novosphingobium album (ex Liu et al. 2023) TaxID=3031130 RepID=A0ABT5WK91_9SPHN|nr:hypothetical protein [Novosphingobium album (ex Liu et al. 2023)]MDE8650467.1 hypothetical protein [Novosphingobium album (ex Liu et al. 2023)]
MTGAAPHGLLPADLLVPDVWKSAEPTYVFNPCIVAVDARIFAFYRVVRADLGRRIAACVIDPLTRQPLPGSATPFSDAIGADSDWYADPRVYTIGGEILVYWNTGFANEGENDQFLIRVDCDRLAPAGKPIRIEIDGPRQKIEKNWILFEQGGSLFAIYSIAPHRVLKLRHWHEDRMIFADFATTYWNSHPISDRFGLPRGGAQPVQRGDKLYHFCHASLRRPTGSVYVAQCYEFEAEPPFAIRRFTLEPLQLPNPLGERFTLPKLNPKVRSVVYPAGNLPLDGDQVLLSYGLNDEACALAPVPFADLDRQLCPVSAVNGMRWRSEDRLIDLWERTSRRFPALGRVRPAR